MHVGLATFHGCIRLELLSFQVAEVLAPSEALEISSCKEFVRRKAPMRDRAEILREIDERSVYSAPLPYDCTLEALTDFFKTAGPVSAVRMRRHAASKDFRGSVFVEFESKEIAQKVSSHPLLALIMHCRSRLHLLTLDCIHPSTSSPLQCGHRMIQHATTLDA